MVSSSTIEPKPNLEKSLVARLKLEGGTSNCWRSLFQLRACASEIVMFFLNGKANLGSNCCHAIKVIQHECWPALLDSLGYTIDEANILEAYCDTTVDILPTSPPPLSVEQTTSEPKNLAP